MLSVAEARTIILDTATPLSTESISVAEAAGRVLASPIISQRAQPPFESSAMDGYAVRASDTPGSLRVVGESAAGRGWSARLEINACVRISTGAALPDGADAIVIQENVERSGDFITAPGAAIGQHVRSQGIDFASGQALLAAGTVLHPSALTLAAAAGNAKLQVYRRPRVSILSGGDEIVPPGAIPNAYQVFDSTRYGIAALIADMGGVPALTPLLCDVREFVVDALAGAMEGSDLVVFLGGASVGDHDHARAAASALQADFLFEKIAVRPGKPTWFARCRQVLMLGLPGNPASALVTARLFLVPLLARLQGADPTPFHSPSQAILDTELQPNGNRENYMRARLELDADGAQRVSAFIDQDSSLMGESARANALLIRPCNDGARSIGQRVPVLEFAASL